MALSTDLVCKFERDGYLCPITVFDDTKTCRLRSHFEALEAMTRGDPELTAAMKNSANWVSPWFDKLARSPQIVGPVASILGPDLLALHVDVFVNEPGTPDYISWHQDVQYWGLDSDDEVTAWLALSCADEKAGCMRFVPGSHKRIVGHGDTLSTDDMLSRGQQVAVDVDESKAVFAELNPGQMSLHHGRMLHASTPNRSQDRHIGIAIRYISPSVKLAVESEKLGARLVRGDDRFGHFDLVAPPKSEFAPEAMKNWRRLRDIEDKILYAGSKYSTP